MSDVTIRDATADDAGFLGWTIRTADRGHLERGGFDRVLPGDEDERLRLLSELARCPVRSFCHYGGFLVAEADGEPAAALSAYTPRAASEDHFVAACREVMDAAGYSRDELGRMFARFAPQQTCHLARPPDSWVVEWVATRPEHRRRGLVAALLETILERGRDRGHATAEIGVLVGNEPARRAYEAAGFRVYDERRHPDFEAAIGAPGVAYLRRAL